MTTSINLLMTKHQLHTSRNRIKGKITSPAIIGQNSMVSCRFIASNQTNQSAQRASVTWSLPRCATQGASQESPADVAPWHFCPAAAGRQRAWKGRCGRSTDWRYMEGAWWRGPDFLGMATFFRLIWQLSRVAGNANLQQLMSEGFSEDMSRWALVIVDTRAFTFQSGTAQERLALVPLLDLFNHRGMVWMCETTEELFGDWSGKMWGDDIFIHIQHIHGHSISIHITQHIILY